MRYARIRLLQASLLIASAVTASCGGVGVETSGAGAGSWGFGGSGGSGGAGGRPASAPAHGPPASAFVSAGQRSASAGYLMVYTLGQSTQSQARFTSAGYVMQGGLVGANGGLP